ncbi:MAG: FAD-binding oxidoreductase [Deltaproteobacteria bacterium]|nr:FAD-binding oxidoreductase [Deltaproteobacteria bacterium]
MSERVREVGGGWLGALEGICGAGFVSIGKADLLAVSRDMWPRSLIAQRGQFEMPQPEAVVWPKDVEEVAAVVRVAAEFGRNIIPFGAGSGVCGGTYPLRGGWVLDMKRMNRILALDEQDAVLRVECGAVGEVLERELQRRGWTLGHFPSSILCSTVGGWVAGRSAGQCSSRYGKIEDMLLSLRWVDAQGEIEQSPSWPAGHAPWSIDPLLAGSEGTLGVLCEAEFLIRPLCEQRHFAAYRFPSVDSGMDAMRLALRQGLRPSVLRLYDEFDTIIAKTGPEENDEPVQGMFAALGDKLRGPLKAVGSLGLKRVLQVPALLNRVCDMLPGGCLLVVIFEGEEDEQICSAAAFETIADRLQAEPLGPGPAEHWWNHRYSVSYKQAPMFMAGAFVDTMEVAATWDKLPGLYRAVKRSLRSLAFVMAHFSHAYREGGSIYFTFAAAADDDEAAASLYDRIWQAAQRAVLAEGGIVSHHHGVGLSKAPFLIEQMGPAMDLARAGKRAFDPDDRMNPGKLGFIQDEKA